MLILGIESSCDETGVALYDTESARLLAHALHTQILMHRDYGGVVPELASRDHIRRTVPLLRKVIASIFYGDMLVALRSQTHAYENHRGDADAMTEKWISTIQGWIRDDKNYSAHDMKRRFYDIAADYATIPITRVPKVKVGVVGEILVKYHPDANNHVVDVIESQDCEAVVPGIMEFMTTRPYISDWNEHYLGMGGSKLGYALMRKGLDLYNAPVREAIDLAHGKFSRDLPMPELVKKAAEVTSIGVQAGEGWLLTAEILELIEQGCPNVICAQPFACLPNHVTGRGMFGKIRRLHPEANIVSIDYDPGASEANQLNRIKLMISAAKKAHRAAEEARNSEKAA